LGGEGAVAASERAQKGQTQQMAEKSSRPLSPHLTIWKWGPHMAVSILHRITGGALTVVGLAILVWWLMAIAQGPEAYSDFTSVSSHWVGTIILIGLSWAFFQHLLSGIRHLVQDAGAALEIETNKRFALLTIIGSVVLTILLWAYLWGVQQ
jgi:succinate dehydrogenase / fumarate reductase cytochrome b subunit